MSEVKVTWVIEAEVFPADGVAALEAEAIRAGHHVVGWKDEWKDPPSPIQPAGMNVASPFVFRGSLGNALWVRENLAWRPGAYCDAQAFCCTSYYPRAERWLLCGAKWRALTAQQFVAEALDQHLQHFFVRPDSPLKPFSGRLLTRDQVSWEAIDYGLYYDARDLLVVVSEPRTITAEWRFVVVDRRVVAGSEYTALGRAAVRRVEAGPAWDFAQVVASALEPPEDVYVLDVCEVDGRYYLLELNPFSGADLYACDPAAVMRAVSEVARRGFTPLPPVQLPPFVPPRP